MTVTQLRLQLGDWQRKHAWRQARLDYAHVRNDKAGIAKWHKLLAEAGVQIRRLRSEIAAKTNGPRDLIVAVARQAAANYRRNPGAYHYYAGGVPNTIILSPTPRSYRSDCSQFGANVYRLAGVKCPGSGSYMYSNTISMANGGGGQLVATPRPGDLAFWGSRWAPHHVEVYIGGGVCLGHGTTPIDENRRRPSFYLTYPQIN